MNRIKLCIQNGHRNAPNGQTGTGGELDLIDKVYSSIKGLIDAQYSDKIELSYDDATVKNGVTADYFVAIHFDGATNPAYDGGFVDDSPTDVVATQSWKFAQTVADHYFGTMGIRFAPEHRTVNSTNYYAFNYTGENTKQFIIECGTLTNTHDHDILQDFDKIGKLLVEGMVAYFTLSEAIFQGTSPTPTPGGDQATIDGLRKELQTSQALVKTLQDKQVSLAQQLTDCQGKLTTLQDRYNKLITAINNLIKS